MLKSENSAAQATCVTLTPFRRFFVLRSAFRHLGTMRFAKLYFDLGQLDLNLTSKLYPNCIDLLWDKRKSAYQPKTEIAATMPSAQVVTLGTFLR